MVLGILVFLLMCISAIYSLAKWSNHKRNLEIFLILHCLCSLLATVVAVFHVILVNETLKFNVQAISLISMIGATITGIPLKMVFRDKPYCIKLLWPFHIGFAISFIISFILHIVMAIVM